MQKTGNKVDDIIDVTSQWPLFGNAPITWRTKIDHNQDGNCDFGNFNVYTTSNKSWPAKRHFRAEGIKALQPPMSVLL